MSNQSLIKKMLLLYRVLTLKFQLVKVIWIATRLPLNSYAIELLESIEFETIGQLAYKKISDPTGEWRFYIPSLDKDAVYRIDIGYGKENILPSKLKDVAMANGRIDEKRYQEVWNEGKTITPNS